MIKVYQTIISPINGNCFAACLSSILHIPLEYIPDFLSEGNGKSWQKITEYLKTINLAPLIIYPLSDKNYSLYLPTLPGTYCILSVPSQCNKCDHAVVAVVTKRKSGLINFKIVHDPIKDNEKYKKVNPKFCLFLVPLKPWNV
jgi:hypothetical protein